MNDPDAAKQVLWLTGWIMAAFGLIVLVGALAARSKGLSVRSMVTKYLAWFVLIPPLLLPLVYSRALFQVVVFLLSVQCIREFARATGLWRDRGVMWLCYVLTAAIYVPIFVGWYGGFQIGPLPAVGLLLLVPITRGRYEHMLQKVCLSVLAVLYFGWFLSHLAYLRNFEHGMAYSYFLVVLVVCNDALGYLWGKWLGRHKLIPRISPNKTVEGAVFSGASVLVIGCLLRPLLLPAVGVMSVVLLAMLISVLGVCGDLVVSFIKRDLSIKDMGSAIPGHGGFLDRCDSMILTAPVFFHTVRWFYGA